MLVQIIAKTNIGKVRNHNEDSFIVGTDPVSEDWVLTGKDVEVKEKGIVFVVADGMGGENAGEIASEIAIESIKKFIKSQLIAESTQLVSQTLEPSLVFAHNNIKDACNLNPDYIGMGTTAVVCGIENEFIHVCWVGDSRAYRYSEDGRVTNHPYFTQNLEMLTQDHSKVWQMVQHGHLDSEAARVHPESNIILQSLGDLYRTPHPEIKKYPLFKNDIILACSDGLNGMLSDLEISDIIKENFENIEVLANKLIEKANENGGKDNITLILCKIIEGKEYNLADASKELTDNSSKTEVIKKKTHIKDILIGLLIGVVLLIVFFNWSSIYTSLSKCKKPIESENSIQSTSDKKPEKSSLTDTIKIDTGVPKPQYIKDSIKSKNRNQKGTTKKNIKVKALQKSNGK